MNRVLGILQNHCVDFFGLKDAPHDSAKTAYLGKIYKDLGKKLRIKKK